MEKLTQKYIKYFYISLICAILVQLVDVVITALHGVAGLDTILLMFLSILNVILLVDNIRRNINQQFTECKFTTKILRFTIALLVVFQALLYFKDGDNIIVLGNHLMTIAIIEIMLTYRIKSIEHLEKLASQFMKDNTSN